ncbi:MAG: DUF2029 domain-containing protein [Bacteroidaceae bacterium]|nr:DUF2029 domain-containing protein [Bacteroidaceae bacterium]
MRWTTIFKSKFFTSQYTIIALGVLLALFATIINIDSNNFDIYTGVFRHTLNRTSLFAQYPEEYIDSNHYGPLFSLIIAPFSFPQRWVGLLLWHVALAMFLYWSIRKSTFSIRQQLFIFWFCANELYTALSLSQFNVAVAALFILTYASCERGKPMYAALCVVVGTFVKIYSIAGLALFIFMPRRLWAKAFAWLVVWSIVAFCLPMVVSSPSYVVSQYFEWYQSLTGKNTENLFAFYQNISVLGIFRKVSGNPNYSDLLILVPAMLIFAMPFLRRKQYANVSFRSTILASVMMFVVLFSTGSESCSYIIALIGVVIWYFSSTWQRNKWDLALLIFVFVVTSMSPTDIFPVKVKSQLIQPYALKSLPVLLVWLKLTFELCKRDYSQSRA